MNFTFQYIYFVQSCQSEGKCDGGRKKNNGELWLLLFIMSLFSLVIQVFYDKTAGLSSSCSFSFILPVSFLHSIQVKLSFLREWDKERKAGHIIHPVRKWIGRETGTRKNVMAFWSLFWIALCGWYDMMIMACLVFLGAHSVPRYATQLYLARELNPQKLWKRSFIQCTSHGFLVYRVMQKPKYQLP